MKERRVLIETYRGWEIMFDTEKEEFYTWSNEHDKEQTKRSYASAKKYIDDFIKENDTFKPIQVMSDPTSMFRGTEHRTLIGLRKDGSFTYEDKNGNKKQFSKYDEKDYFLIDEANDPIFAEITKLKQDKSIIEKKIKEVSERLIKVDVEQIRKNYLGE